MIDIIIDFLNLEPRSIQERTSTRLDDGFYPKETRAFL